VNRMTDRSVATLFGFKVRASRCVLGNDYPFPDLVCEACFGPPHGHFRLNADKMDKLLGSSASGLLHQAKLKGLSAKNYVVPFMKFFASAPSTFPRTMKRQSDPLCRLADRFEFVPGSHRIKARGPKPVSEGHYLNVTSAPVEKCSSG